MRNKFRRLSSSGPRFCFCWTTLSTKKQQYRIHQINSNSKKHCSHGTLSRLLFDRTQYLTRHQRVHYTSLSRIVRVSSSTALLSSVSSSTSSELIISDKAVARLKHLQELERDPNLKLRVTLDSGGCAGYKVTFSIDTNPPAIDDRIITRDGVFVVVDHISLEYLRNSVLDFKEEMAQSSFVIVNDNASTCGCGSSISLTPKSK
jgi:iron-sulfur cluster assembly accessory protein